MIRALCTACVAVVLAMTLTWALAHAASSVVHDPRGDSLSTKPYLDVVHAEVIEQQGRGTLLFMMLLAGPIPEQPPEHLVLIWPFHVNTGPGAPGNPPLYNEYIVRVRGSRPALDQPFTFQGHLVNRVAVPAATPQPITFSIDGATVKAFVPLSALGNPSNFGWNAGTRIGGAPNYEDLAPDGCDPSPVPCGLATWEQ